MGGNSGSLKTATERLMAAVNVTGRFDTTITCINYDNYTSTCVQYGDYNTDYFTSYISTPGSTLER